MDLQQKGGQFFKDLCYIFLVVFTDVTKPVDKKENILRVLSKQKNVVFNINVAYLQRKEYICR